MQGPEDASGVAANQVLKSASFTLLDSRNQPSIGIVRSSRIEGRTGIRRRRIQIFCTDPRAQCAAQRKIGNGTQPELQGAKEVGQTGHGNGLDDLSLCEALATQSLLIKGGELRRRTGQLANFPKESLVRLGDVGAAIVSCNLIGVVP